MRCASARWQPFVCWVPLVIQRGSYNRGLVHGQRQPCQDISVAVFRAWDLIDVISIEGLQQLVGILEVCYHGSVFGKEVMIDLMNNQLKIAEYLNLSSPMSLAS
ncbi:hypothetical protein L3X38_032600 [Prunus dulcis]|uniref:Uncharacterized protein n=1 Tax=Prunus dulcis TaxID=3755 RepID=A0AAD4YWS5_PRUDU|nr:hypothetical protein L3X38_032600 [Prunus dulcis]